MEILLTNDDGIHAPGLEALRHALAQLGRVQVVAPKSEQSGVSHSITYLQPLMTEEVWRNDDQIGHAVAGSPADCVKLAVLELCRPAPDLIVSGINAGANVGINVLYSGTVAAAIEGAFFGHTSLAVSLDLCDQPDYRAAARQAVQVIAALLESGIPPGSLWNINLPRKQPGGPKGVKVLPMGSKREQELLERRIDPRGRTYYWSATDASSAAHRLPDTDVEGLADGFITVTPLHFELTRRDLLDAYRHWHPRM